MSDEPKSLNMKSFDEVTDDENSDSSIVEEYLNLMHPCIPIKPLSPQLNLNSEQIFNNIQENKENIAIQNGVSTLKRKYDFENGNEENAAKRFYSHNEITAECSTNRPEFVVQQFIAPVENNQHINQLIPIEFVSPTKSPVYNYVDDCVDYDSDESDANRIEQQKRIDKVKRVLFDCDKENNKSNQLLEDDPFINVYHDVDHESMYKNPLFENDSSEDYD